MVEGTIAGGWWVTWWYYWCCGWTEIRTIYHAFLGPKRHTNFVTSAMMSPKTLGYLYKTCWKLIQSFTTLEILYCYGCCLLRLSVWWPLYAHTLMIAIAGGVEDSYDNYNKIWHVGNELWQNILQKINYSHCATRNRNYSTTTMQ